LVCAVHSDDVLFCLFVCDLRDAQG
ncbi:hypothetical protein A2U01_0110547, partial [Trifolium medium]|nr:hypothetical protein [Trifolium medium]